MSFYKSMPLPGFSLILSYTMFTIRSTLSACFGVDWRGDGAGSATGEVGWGRFPVCKAGKWTAGGGVGPPLPATLAIAWFAK